MRALGLLLAGVAAFAASPALAETIAITGGRVVVGDGSPPIDGGTVVIRDGRVVAAGAGVNVPAGATTVDATGKWVTPGLVAGFSRIGLVEVDAVSETNDISANNSPFNAAIAATCSSMSRSMEKRLAAASFRSPRGLKFSQASSTAPKPSKASPASAFSAFSRRRACGA